MSGRLFTQDEVDRIVEKRLAAERRKADREAKTLVLDLIEQLKDAICIIAAGSEAEGLQPLTLEQLKKVRAAMGLPKTNEGRNKE